MAYSGLLLEDFDMAVVAGTSIISDPVRQLVTSRVGIISPTSTCHTFDDAADGFGRGEGIVAMLVTRLSHAVRRQLPIRAVIRASAINTNGKGLSGISQPGIEGQAANIRKAYTKAGLGYRETGFFECHGTGTKRGDPIEIAALAGVFGDYRSQTNPLLLSAVKSQIGHTEGASGLASLLKAILSLEHRRIPGVFGIKKLNPALDLLDGKLEIVTKTRPWPSHQRYGRVSINSFGYGGANAHLIVDSAESFLAERLPSLVSHKWCSLARPKSQQHQDHAALKVITISGNKPETLLNNITRIAQIRDKHELEDLIHTLHEKRTHHAHRAFTISQAGTAWDSADTWKTAEMLPQPKMAFVFTGQGGQWPRMGIELLQQCAVARKTFQDIQEAMNRIPERPSWTLYSALDASADESDMMKDPRVAVTLTTAIQVMLVDVLRNWGITPSSVVAHSSGEAASAYASGFLTAAETVITAYYRGVAVIERKKRGAMLAVGLGAEATAEWFGKDEELYLACHNSPESTTVSGTYSAIDALAERLTTNGIFARKVKTSGMANHCPLVEEAAAYFRQSFQGALPNAQVLAQRNGTVKMYSCVTADVVHAEDCGISYWAQLLSGPVLFDQAVTRMLTEENEINVLVEIGPHSTLAGPLRQIKSSIKNRSLYLPSLIRFSDGLKDMLTLAGSLHINGCAVDLNNVNNYARSSDEHPDPRTIVDLPTYGWAYNKPDLFDYRSNRCVREREYLRHDLLGSRLSNSTPSDPVWRNYISLDEVPWLKDHNIDGRILMPASCYILMAIEAFQQIVPHHITSDLTLEHVHIRQAIVLDDKQWTEVFLQLHLDRQLLATMPAAEFEVWTANYDNKWTKHATGRVSAISSAKSWHESLSSKLPTQASISRSRSAFYQSFKGQGVLYGPSFQTLKHIRVSETTNKLLSTAESSVKARPTAGLMVQESGYRVHPATLDGCLQNAYAALSPILHGHTKKAFVPTSVPYLRLSGTCGKTSDDCCTVRSQAQMHGLRDVSTNFELSSEVGGLLVEGEVHLSQIETASLHRPPAQPYQRLCWAPDIDHLQDYTVLSQTMAQEKNDSVDTSALEVRTELSSILGLLSFKKPRLRVVEFINRDISDSRVVANAVSSASLLSYRQYTCVFAEPATPNSTTVKDLESHKDVKLMSDREWTNRSDLFDVLILPDSKIVLGEATNMLSRLEERGYVIIKGHHLRSEDLRNLKSLGLQNIWRTSSGLLVFVHGTESTVGLSPVPAVPFPNIVYLIGTDDSTYLKALQANMSLVGANAVAVRNPRELPPRAHIISLLECDKPFFLELDAKKMNFLQAVLMKAASITWLSSSEHPGTQLFTGMMRVLSAEYPAVSLRCIEGDWHNEASRNVGAQLAVKTSSSAQDVEHHLRIEKGQCYISRCISADASNRSDLDMIRGIQSSATLTRDMQLSVPSLDDLDEFYFEQRNPVARGPVGSSMVVRPSMWCLDRQNALTLSGRTHSQFFSYECYGKITHSGDNPGMHQDQGVVCLLGSSFRREEIVSPQLCWPVSSVAEAESMLGTTMPMFLAYRVLMEICTPSKLRVVVIRSEDESFCDMFSRFARTQSIQTAKLTSTTKLADLNLPRIDLLVDTMDHLELLSSENCCEIEKIVVIERKARDLQERRNESTSSKIVYINVERIMQNPEMVGKSFDLAMRYAHRHKLFRGSRELQKYSLKDLAEAVNAALSLTDNDRVVVTCDDTTLVPVCTFPTSHNKDVAEGRRSLFRPNASYLMVGCLGGLGCSIARWMVRNGAKHFIFLSRSGARSQEAMNLLNYLESQDDGFVEVVKGDVSKKEDVRRAIQSAKCPVKGVIQAATTFDECRFKDMSSERWHSNIDAKVKGTMNLHELTMDIELDFFVMTSSSIGMTGATTQSAYAAANGFLDAMAIHRRRRGLPAVSLSIGMVTGIGHVESEGLEDVLAKRGGYPIDESEFLRMMDLACNNNAPYDSPDDGVIITGLDPTRISPSDLSSTRLIEPRFSHLANTIELLSAEEIGKSNSTSKSSAANRMKELLVDAKLNHNAIGELLREAILNKIAALCGFSEDQLESLIRKRLTDLGLDSIVTVELQSWIKNEFRVGIDLMDLVTGSQTVEALVELVHCRLEDSQ